MIKANFSQDRITSSSAEAFSLYEKSRLGEKKQGKILYSNVEALYLLQKKKLSLFSNSRLLTEEQAIRKIKRSDKKIETKLIVFSDLRKKGYIVKTALKFGAEFRVYDKKAQIGKDHARWILFTVKESSPFSWHDFTAKNRVAHSTKKNLLIAIVDEESSPTYYEVAWTKT
tara:strand:- start:2431 stop:2943 length:513 start_codon:yes stop_codon:yes gene_type:complete